MAYELCIMATVITTEVLLKDADAALAGWCLEVPRSPACPKASHTILGPNPCRNVAHRDASSHGCPWRKEQEQRKTTRKRGKHGVLPYRPRRRKLHLRLLQEPKAKTIDPARKWKGKFRILVPHPFAGRRQILI